MEKEMNGTFWFFRAIINLNLFALGFSIRLPHWESGGLEFSCLLLFGPVAMEFGRWVTHVHETENSPCE